MRRKPLRTGPPDFAVRNDVGAGYRIDNAKAGEELGVAVGEGEVRAVVVPAGKAVRPGGRLAVVVVLARIDFLFARNAGVEEEDGAGVVLDAVEVRALQRIG